MAPVVSRMSGVAAALLDAGAEFESGLRADAVRGDSRRLRSERMRRHRRLQQQGDDREHGVKRAATHGGTRIDGETRIEGADEFSAAVQGARWRLRQTRASRGGPLAAVRAIPGGILSGGGGAGKPGKRHNDERRMNSAFCGLFVTGAVDIMYLILRAGRRSGRR